jgi:ergothioneine biosynthesis protein EgtB
MSLRTLLQDLPVHAGEHPQQRFREVRATTTELVLPLSAEDCQLQSMPDASPTKWHLAHTTWFFETFILVAHLQDYQVFDAAFKTLFNSYYNGVGDKHPRAERGLISRPSLTEVLQYRAHVDAAMERLFNRGELSTTLAELIVLGTHHEQQHQELILTDIKHAFYSNPARPMFRRGWPLTTTALPHCEFTWVQGGVIEIGHADAAFAFDNECPRHAQYLRDFQIATYPVTHGDFAEFVADGGYRRPELWLSLGWDQVQRDQWTAPMYWRRDGDQWITFTLHGEMPINHGTPMCHLSYFEADAYARWAGGRLPTEAEWEHACLSVSDHSDANFLESRQLHPVASTTSTSKVTKMLGDVWEWTQSSYSPYPGFKIAEGAIGEYNGKFMCNQYVLRGGSCVTPRSHIRPTYRNFFPPAARWQFSGLRLAKDAA